MQAIEFLKSPLVQLMPMINGVHGHSCLDFMILLYLVTLYLLERFICIRNATPKSICPKLSPRVIKPNSSEYTDA